MNRPIGPVTSWIAAAFACLLAVGCRALPPSRGAGDRARAKISPLAPVYAAALGGDMKRALAELGTLAVAQLEEVERRERACLLRTFAERKAAPAATVSDPWVAELIDLYRRYWTSMLLGETSRADAERQLFTQLQAHVHAAAPAAAASATLDDLAEALGPILLARGLHSIRGVTQPYYELMLWRNERSQIFDVSLPETRERVKVVFMEDFVELGWSAYATCGRHYSAGWSKPDALYCVAAAYDLDSEDFRVSYLAHEAQHFADQRRFPELEQPEREYRAKLVELIESRATTASLAERFAVHSGDSRDAPHNFANGRLARDLGRALFGALSSPTRWRWREVDAERIRRASAALLSQNTARLVRSSPEKVTRVLE